MIRGTTPTLKFKLPFEAGDISHLSIAFAQNNAMVMEKTETDCDFDADVITLKLTQADTLALQDNRSVEIQLRIKTADGNALASFIKTVSVNKILRDGEI